MFIPFKYRINITKNNTGELYNSSINNNMELEFNLDTPLGIINLGATNFYMELTSITCSVLRRK